MWIRRARAGQGQSRVRDYGGCKNEEATKQIVNHEEVRLWLLHGLTCTEEIGAPASTYNRWINNGGQVLEKAN